MLEKPGSGISAAGFRQIFLVCFRKSGRTHSGELVEGMVKGGEGVKPRPFGKMFNAQGCTFTGFQQPAGLFYPVLIDIIIEFQPVLLV